jgi:hypothetical protein
MHKRADQVPVELGVPTHEVEPGHLLAAASLPFFDDPNTLGADRYDIDLPLDLYLPPKRVIDSWRHGSQPAFLVLPVQ